MRIRVAILAGIAGILLLPYNNCGRGLPDISLASTGAGSAPATPSPGSFASHAGASCRAILESGGSVGNGSYWVDPDGPGGGEAPFVAYCDMQTDGGGWMLIARNDQSTTFTNFNKTWAEFKAGFGDLTVAAGRGWIGNERIHLLTGLGVQLLVRTNNADHLYAGFNIENEAGKYRLHVAGTAQSNDGGAFASYHNNLPFSTADQDNDTYLGNCANQFATGWWHGSCYNMSLAGNNNSQSYWRNSANALAPFSFIEFWIR